ncbi:hypothetical protein POPTR_004G086050v4 [Populus trichocarpa]|uniref:Uncharacterized protein n=1 Tax=Populus trichocarpa TaxID=3694 RepID=A0ACC0T3P2_POPTR|nr:hypothetical protein POPTR_004G086050v4 [Populus trichocarpa]
MNSRAPTPQGHYKRLSLGLSRCTSDQNRVFLQWLAALLFRLLAKTHGANKEEVRCWGGFPMPPANLVDYCSYVVNDDDRGHRYFICNPPKRQFQRLALPS